MEKFKKLLHKICGTNENSDLQPKEILSYSIAGFGQNLICTLISTYLLLFLTDGARIDGMWLAWLFLGVRLFDAFNDPIMGTIVDFTKTKNGDKMRPYLKMTPIPIAILTILCFVNLGNGVDPVAKFIYISVIYVVWSVVYTIIDVPYWGLSTAMTSDTEKRNIMLTIARVLCMAGAGLVTLFIPVLQGIVERSAVRKAFEASTHTGLSDQAQTAVQEWLKGAPDALDIGGLSKVVGGDGLTEDAVNQANSWIGEARAIPISIMFIIVAIVVSVIAIPLFYIGYKNTMERFKNSEKPKSLGYNLRLLFKNKPLLLIVLSGILGGARYVYTASAIYYAKYNLGNTAITTAIMLLLLPGGLIASVLTPYLSKKFGKKNVYIYSHLIGAIALFILYFVGVSTNGIGKASYIVGALVLLIVGVPSGFSNILSYAMIADTVDYLEDKVGDRAEGICFAMQTFISKIGMAIVAFITLFILSTKFGYTQPNNPKQPEEVLRNIWLISTLIPAISTLLSVVPFFFYKFTEAEQKKAVARVAEKKGYKA